MARPARTYSIFLNPLDYPSETRSRRRRRPSRRQDNYVVRGADVGPAGEHSPDPEPVAVVGSLDEARQRVPSPLVRLPRDPRDVGSLVETWLSNENSDGIQH